MEQMTEVKGQRAEEVVSAEEQIVELSLDLLPNVGGGVVIAKL